MPERSAIGIDLGGTHLRAGLIGADGGVTHFLKTVSRAAESRDAPLEGIANAVCELQALAGRGVLGVGLGSPGVIDPGTGWQGGEAPHPAHWGDLPPRDAPATPHR